MIVIMDERLVVLFVGQRVVLSVRKAEHLVDWTVDWLIVWLVD